MFIRPFFLIMKAAQLFFSSNIENRPLQVIDIPTPECDINQVLIRVATCGVCHTDLHIAEGELKPPSLPLTLGHQVVGTIVQLGNAVKNFKLGEVVGVPWLHSTCGNCDSCLRQEENLCLHAKFTGFHVNGGFSEFMCVDQTKILPIPTAFQARQAAPLLCAGIIGYRSLRKADLHHGETLGLVGFGASAHLAIQIAHTWSCKTYVFTRSESHRKHALELGAAWVGGIGDNPPEKLDRIIIFAPDGRLIPLALDKIRRGGTMAINAVFMTNIPELAYSTIYGEKTIRAVTNATHQDGLEFLNLAAQIPIIPKIQVYSLENVNRALLDLKFSKIEGEAVIQIQ